MTIVGLWLSTLNRCFAWTFGTAAVLAQGGGGLFNTRKYTQSSVVRSTTCDAPLLAVMMRRIKWV